MHIINRLDALETSLSERVDLVAPARLERLSPADGVCHDWNAHRRIRRYDSNYRIEGVRRTRFLLKLSF